MELNKAILENKAQRPAFVNDYTGKDEAGNAVQKHGIKLTKMDDGTSITLKLTSNPNEWPAIEGKYGVSYLGHFEVADGTPVSMFVTANQKSKGRVAPLEKGKPAPAGKTLLARFQEFTEGDVVKISLEVKKLKDKTDTWRCFTVEPVTGFQ
jgi:hypothetical protein